MNEMVERVARAIDPTCWDVPNPVEAARRENTEHVTEQHINRWKSAPIRRNRALKLASAAIMAMHEPTQAMLAAVRRVDNFAPTDHAETWKIMIEEVLK